MMGSRVGQAVRLPVVLTVVASLLAVAYPAGGGRLALAATGPNVAFNSVVDMDQNLAFPENKQNEPAITRDPATGALIAGANDELAQPSCSGTTAPLGSPCPFAPGSPTSAYHASTDDATPW